MIRLADISDLESVLQITHDTISKTYSHYYARGVVDFFLQHHSREHVLPDIENRIVWLLEEDGCMAGTVTIKGNAVNRLFVLPECQSHGYGSQLMDFAEAKIAEKFSHVHIDSSLAAKQMYLKRGYKEKRTCRIPADNGDILIYDEMEKRVERQPDRINDDGKIFELRIDSSKCTSLLEGGALLDGGNYDAWWFNDIRLESGKIYGLISEYGEGSMYLSYLLGGKVEFGDLRIFSNDIEMSKEELEQISWNLEPSNEIYKNAIVKKSIEKAMHKNGDKEGFHAIAEKFLLTEPRYNNKLSHLSGERWRASAALGYVNRKKIFFAPYRTSSFYYSMCSSVLLKVLRELTSDGAIVLLPVGSDEVMKHIADECIYIKREYDILRLKNRYNELFGKGEWIKT